MTDKSWHEELHETCVSELRRQIDDLRRCSTCGGDRNSHPSGKPCICGDGTREGEVAGLRKTLVAAQDRYHNLASYEEAYRNEGVRAEALLAERNRLIDFVRRVATTSNIHASAACDLLALLRVRTA